MNNTFEKMKEEGYLQEANTPEKEEEARDLIGALEKILNISEEVTKKHGVTAALKCLKSIETILLMEHLGDMIKEAVSKEEKIPEGTTKH